MSREEELHEMNQSRHDSDTNDIPDPPTYEEALMSSRSRTGATNRPAEQLETNVDADSDSQTSVDHEIASPKVRGSLADPPPEYGSLGAGPSEVNNELSNEEKKVQGRLRASILSRRHSGFDADEFEELEMMDLNYDGEGNEDSLAEIDSVVSPEEVDFIDPGHRNADGHTSEIGGSQPSVSRSDATYECDTFPVLNPLISFVMKRWNRTSNTKRILIVLVVVLFLGLLLLVSLLPASFVYISYYEMGFSRNKITGVHDYSTVYQTGCYLLAPQDEIVSFQSTAHTLDLRMSVYNSDGMTIGLNVMLQYFLRPEELAQLFHKYHFDYDEVIRKVAVGTVKNTAIEFSMDDYRLNRTFVEVRIFHQLKRILSGDCCAACCPSCADARIKCSPSDCKEYNCSSGYHVDVRFFQFHRITIPAAIMDQYMKQVVLLIDHQTAVHIQDSALVRKSTQVDVQAELNAATELRENAKAAAYVIRKTAEAEKEKRVQIAYQKSIKKLFEHLNITTEEAQTSFMLLKALKDVNQNLYSFTYGYDKQTVMSP